MYIWYSNKDKSNKSEVIGKDNDPKAPSMYTKPYLALPGIMIS